MKYILLVIAAIFLTGCVTTENHSSGDVLEQQGFVRTGATEYVKPNAYGLGTGMNQFGQPVKTVTVDGF